ncbi:formate dehydrogenase accessory sulfurtransferase FdhD [Sphingorhabdus sp.]|uniref:formate dehydrogenase accessory sulfurtransferase FdhD n=1 Tax=Sphingorhabdus sp. TaxID=1902408 RepID=UPI0035946AF7
MPQPENGTKPFRFSVIRAEGGPLEIIDRQTIVEAAISIEYNGIGYAVMMATPVDLDDFGTGFSLSEGLIENAGQILAIDSHKTDLGWILRIQLPNESAEKVFARARQRVSESSCGLCGMDNLHEVMRLLPRMEAQIDVPDAAIFAALSSLREHQTLNAATGSAHAAAFCAADGTILMTREDVGRHNALDKLIGALARLGIDPSSGFILLTARCSLELVQKTILANCATLVTISAASDLALQFARSSGLRLVSLARPDSALVAIGQID